MRALSSILVSIFVLGWLVLAGCSGDSSSIMSVWNDSGVVNPPGTGGASGGSTSAQGGSGGQIGTGTTSVPGGVRDVATAQCISGGSCSIASADLSCIKNYCGASLTTCYNASATSGSGACAQYAHCLLKCPCGAGKSTCEGDCLQNHVTADFSCLYCLSELATCANQFSCPMTTPC